MKSRVKVNVGLRVSSILVLVFIWWVAALWMNDIEVLPGPVLIAKTIASNLVSLGPEGHSA